MVRGGRHHVVGSLQLGSPQHHAFEQDAKASESIATFAVLGTASLDRLEISLFQ